MSTNNHAVVKRNQEEIMKALHPDIRSMFEHTLQRIDYLETNVIFKNDVVPEILSDVEGCLKKKTTEPESSEPTSGDKSEKTKVPLKSSPAGNKRHSKNGSEKIRNINSALKWSQSVNILPGRFLYEVGSRSDGSLDKDTFTIMMTEDTVWSKGWMLGVCAFTIQTVLGAMVANDQLRWTYGESLLNVPIRVTPFLLIVQFFTIMLALKTQLDVLKSVHVVASLWPSNPAWKETIGYHSKDDTEHDTTIWLKRVLLPNSLKFIQGALALLNSWVIIVQSSDIIDLLMNFTALFIISSVDNLFFSFARIGYLGQDLLERANKALAVEIVIYNDDSVRDDRNNMLETQRKMRFVRQIVPVIIILSTMIGWWLFIVHGQITLKYVQQRYPNCFFYKKILPISNIANGDCEQEYNTPECGHDGGDCETFNAMLPNCKTDTPWKVGDGNCDLMLNTKDCSYDFGDCVARNKKRKNIAIQCVLDVDQVTNRTCDFGDIEYNLFDIVKCECSNSSTLSVNSEASEVAISSDGDRAAFASKGILKIYDYGLNGGVSLSKEITIAGMRDFVMAMSLNGDKLIIGCPECASPNRISAGAVYIFSESVAWSQLGSTIFGGDGFHIGMSVGIASDRDRIALCSSPHLSTYKHMDIYDWDTGSNDWNQTIKLDGSIDMGDYFSLIISFDGDRLAYGGINLIHFYSLSDMRLIRDVTGGKSLTLSGDGGKAAIALENEVTVYKLSLEGDDYILIGDDHIDVPTSSEEVSVSFSPEGNWLSCAPREGGNIFIYFIEDYTWTFIGSIVRTNATGVVIPDKYHLSKGMSQISANGKHVIIGAKPGNRARRIG